MQERIDPTPYSAARLLADIERAAQLIDAPFDAATTRRALEVYHPEFSQCVVQLKATCRPGTGVYYRFFYNGPNDLTLRGQRAGLIKSDSTPNLRLQSEVLQRFPRATRAGLDFDSGFGLAKLWTFTGGPMPVEAILSLPMLPPSLRAHADFFARHGLRHVFFFASDYQGSTMNIYFGWEDSCRNPAWIERMVAETGGTAPSSEVSQAILDSQAVSGGVGMTFSWDDPELMRWCLYSLEAPPGVPLPERLARFKNAPTLNLEPQFNVAWSFGHRRTYVKLEKSYCRDATYFLTNQMGGDLRRRQASNA